MCPESKAEVGCRRPEDVELLTIHEPVFIAVRCPYQIQKRAARRNDLTLELRVPRNVTGDDWRRRFEAKHLFNGLWYERRFFDQCCALIRMLGESEDLVPPGTFLYIGERFDLIQGIDRWVLRQAIALLAGERQSGRDLNLAVNVSAKSVTDPTLPEFLARELANAGIDGQGLCVEVTETAAIVNLDRAKRFAHALTELGCEFALDDFGAGFASFYYLKHMAFDFIKIDGEFIRDLAESRVNQLVVRSVVAIARGMGKRTIAESVEAEDSLRLLKGYGVDYAQGFYVAKPQPLTALNLAQASALPAL